MPQLAADCVRAGRVCSNGRYCKLGCHQFPVPVLKKVEQMKKVHYICSHKRNNEIKIFISNMT